MGARRGGRSWSRRAGGGGAGGRQSPAGAGGVGRGAPVRGGGEPGIGKSRMVRAGCPFAADSGCQVYWGAGDELGQALPLLPLLDGLQINTSEPDSRRGAGAEVLRGEGAAGRGARLADAG